MVTAADPPQCEAERFYQALKLGEADVSRVASRKAVPELLSPRTSHPVIMESVADRIDDKIATIVC